VTRVSPATAVGIVVTVVLGLTLAVTGVMFWWAAREDGRDQDRVDAQLHRNDD
jgi:Na+-transporting NADH:ubiquinone oxidoreductase subunit NqrE